MARRRVFFYSECVFSTFFAMISALLNLVIFSALQANNFKCVFNNPGFGVRNLGRYQSISRRVRLVDCSRRIVMGGNFLTVWFAQIVSGECIRCCLIVFGWNRAVLLEKSMPHPGIQIQRKSPKPCEAVPVQPRISEKSGWDRLGSVSSQNIDGP